ncbi:hypothetical protein L195_g001041 [Trifolium pratense]|uniref:Uncharacterized protein n=1 Tax=Trifolium pratense TaxID=57577 RepID=A0A2K3NNK2_TRIPR|nr:hypothetical protein L195_g001041 [Trifolium pratense]
MKERSRVTNLVSCEITAGIRPTNPAIDKFRYVNFSNLLNPDGMEELKLLSDKSSFRRCNTTPIAASSRFNPRS